MGGLVNRWMDDCMFHLASGKIPGKGKGSFPRKSGPGLETLFP